MPNFYRGADGAVIVFDVTKRETFKLAKKWFMELDTCADSNLKIILVGNKYDLPNKDVNGDEARALAKEYKANFIEVSALTGENVDAIFETLTTSIYYGEKETANKNQLKVKKSGLNLECSTANPPISEYEKKNSGGGCCVIF